MSGFVPTRDESKMGDHMCPYAGDIATLKEKVRVIEESDHSVMRRFVSKIDQNNFEIKVLRDGHIELQHVVEDHVKWSAQIPINYERLHLKVESLETVVREGFHDISGKVKGQDRDFNYFIRIPAKTFFVGMIGVFGLAFANTIMRFSHAVGDWFFGLFTFKYPK